jgi:hypothetical protein
MIKTEIPYNYDFNNFYGFPCKMAENAPALDALRYGGVRHLKVCGQTRHFFAILSVTVPGGHTQRSGPSDCGIRATAADGSRRSFYALVGSLPSEEQ